MTGGTERTSEKRDERTDQRSHRLAHRPAERGQDHHRPRARRPAARPRATGSRCSTATRSASSSPPGLGFTREDRHTNVQRIGFVAELLASHGVKALVPVIAPYADSREAVRKRHQATGTAYLEVHVATPVEVCSVRDVKGLYAKQAAGEITGLTGVDDPYEAPADTGPADRDAAADRAGVGRRTARAAHREGPRVTTTVRRACRPKARDSPYALIAPGRAGVGGGAHLPRGGGRVRAAGDPLLRRQGLDRHAAPGAEGVRPGAGAVLAAARRHRAQLPRGAGVPRPHRRASTGCGCTSPPCRTTSTTASCASAPTAPATRCRPCR